MKNVGTVATFAVLFGTLGVLSLFLLVTSHYFSIHELHDTHFGILSVDISGAVSYTHLTLPDE